MDNVVVTINKANMDRIYHVVMKAYETKGDGAIAMYDRTRGMAQLQLLKELGLVDEDNKPTWA